MAGSLRKYTVQEADNAALGQAGSIFLNGEGDATAPPANTAFVAITIIADAKFESTTGLIPEDGVGRQYISTDTASDSTATAVGSATSTPVVNTVEFPAGVTIYGRWKQIELNAGSVIAYIG